MDKLTIIFIVAVGLALCIGVVIGLLISIRMIKKVTTKEQQAEAVNELEEALKSFIVGTENKLSRFVSFLNTVNEKAGPTKKDIVTAQAVQYIKDKNLKISSEKVSEMIDNLVTFMNKKTEPLNDEKEVAEEATKDTK